MKPEIDRRIRGFSIANLFFVFAIAAALRVTVSLVLPDISPDGLQYLKVGDNIAQNGCISLSPVETGECTPHWGGNHPPGYPIIISISRFLSDEVSAIRIIQSLLAGAAIAWLANAVSLSAGRNWAGLSVGLLLAVSPVHVGWARLILPDTLAVAATLWVFAEILLSLHQGRFRTFPIALALIGAFFVRYDGVLLIVPVAITGFVLHRPIVALKKGIACALILSLPIAVWS